VADPFIDYFFRFTGTAAQRKSTALSVLGEWLKDDAAEEDGIGYNRSHILRFRVISNEGSPGTPPDFADAVAPTYVTGLFIHIALAEIRPDVRDIAQCFLVLSRQRAIEGRNPVLYNVAPVALRNYRFEPVFAGVVYQPRVSGDPDPA
jgi:hypothetical protein